MRSFLQPFCVLFFFFAAILTAETCLARGGGVRGGGFGGGGRGGSFGGGARSFSGSGYRGSYPGGGYRSPSMNRSPSMSPIQPGRTQPNRFYGGSGVTRPGGDGVRRPGGETGFRPGEGSFTRPGGGGAGTAVRPSNRQLENFLNLPAERPAMNERPNFANRPANLPDRGQTASDIRSRWDQRRDGNRPFTNDWWQNHRPDDRHVPDWHPWNHWDHWRHSNYWWGWATPVVLTGWFPYGWTTPYYYDYGPGGNVYYQGDTVYVNNEPACSTQDYYNQADALATNVPAATQPAAEVPSAQPADDSANWLPLGVFAMTQEGVNDSTVSVQLAVNKQGVIAGTYYNETTGATRPLQGSVDKTTQRAAWTYADGKDTSIVMETSVYNLTKDHCTALIHFGPDQTQTWLMVRLKGDDQQQTTQPTNAQDALP